MADNDPYSGIGRGLHAMLLAHVALSMPYVIVVVGARLQSFGVDYFQGYYFGQPTVSPDWLTKKDLEDELRVARE